VPREAAMRLVNHASALVHEIYQREKVDDVMQWRDAVKFPISKTSLVLKPALPTVPVVAIWRKESETEPVKILS
jgi:hypothetical protein